MVAISPARLPIPVADTRATALAVSDDPFVLERLRAPFDGGGFALTCMAWDEACVPARIAMAAPDLLLIDVALGAGAVCGLDFHASVAASRSAVAFLSTNADTATRAFDAGAIDYLVKPLAPARVDRLIVRALTHIAQRDARDRVREAEQELARLVASPVDAELWALRRGGEWLRIPAEAIDWLSVQDDYVCVHAWGGEHLVRGSLDRWIDAMGAARFARVHRRAAVAIDRVARLHPGDGRAAQVELRDGTRLPVGRIHGRALPHVIGRTVKTP